MIKFDNEDVEFVTHPNRLKGVAAPFLPPDISDPPAFSQLGSDPKKLKRIKILKALGKIFRAIIPPLIFVYVYTGVNFINHLGSEGFHVRFHILCSILNGIIILAAYSRASKTSPGPIPSDWRDWNGYIAFQDKPPNPPHCKTARKSQQHYDLRFCRHCQIFQPPRCFHCSKCDTCVCRMDHHCVFINNCVGAKNHRYFLQFLVWMLTGLVYWGYLWLYGHYFVEHSPGVRYLIVSLLLPILGFLSFLFVGLILLTQIFFIKKGITTIEKKYFPGTVGLYDLGFWKNLQLVMNAPKIFQWVFPVKIP